jgi:hypothetical protein
VIDRTSGMFIPAENGKKPDAFSSDYVENWKRISFLDLYSFAMFVCYVCEPTRFTIVGDGGKKLTSEKYLKTMQDKTKFEKYLKGILKFVEIKLGVKFMGIIRGIILEHEDDPKASHKYGIKYI